MQVSFPYLSPEGNADLLHLLGADIVSTHDEAFGVPDISPRQVSGLDSNIDNNELTHQGGW